MKIGLILDRVENDTAIFTDDTGTVYECEVSLIKGGFSEDDAFEAEVSDGKIVSLEKTVNPNAGANKKRLNDMFKNKFKIF